MTPRRTPRSAVIGAQRLSASQRWASGIDVFHGHQRAVLNAFRHHRGGHDPAGWVMSLRTGCSTPFGITEVGMFPTSTAWIACDACSTPFGITEVGIPAQRGTTGGQRVLIAFRHHRGGHTVELP